MAEITLKTVKELTGLEFKVPFYQRGYRWKKTQVKQLLDDIKQFQPTEKHPFYFLQALVVSAKKEEKIYHVVDGQQRLTTLALILNGQGLKITYDREANSVIDKHYKIVAQGCINDSFPTKDNREVFCNKVLEKCRFLVYEVEEAKEKQTFSELNSGKIPAKDSELVKCVLLSPGADESAAVTQARAAEWDMMEREMQNEAFFAFMTPRGTWREEDRMTVLFRYAGFTVQQNTAEVFPFLTKIQEEIARSSRVTVWKKIYSAYYRLIAWFQDPLMYHAFGWYVHQNGIKPFSTLEEIKAKLAEMKPPYESSLSEDGDAYNNGQNDKLHSYLLLHNTAFCWERWPMRYDFQRHREIGSWSLEHIFARNQDKLTENELTQWIPGIKADRITKYMEDCQKNEGNKWLENQPELKGKYPAEETDNTIKNLALLSKDANSSLNNSLFEGKRDLVVQWAANGWGKYWVPPVTEAVFLKSMPGLSMTTPYWSDADKKGYFECMKLMVVKFTEAVKARFSIKNEGEGK